MKHYLILLLAAFSIYLTSCSDPGSDYVDIWVMRGKPDRITISQNGNSFQIMGSPTFQGVYVLDDEGRLVNGLPNTRFEYDDDNDVIVWAGNDLWPTTEVFERLATHNEKLEGLDSNISVIASPVEPQVIDTNKLVGHWSTKYDYYAGYQYVTLEITQSTTDSCGEYMCKWIEVDNMGGNKKTKQWCAYMNSGILEADMEMGKRAAHMHTFKLGTDDRTLSVTFTYNSVEYLPWHLEFKKN